MNRKPIPERFTKCGFKFAQVERQGDVAIFLKSSPHGGRSFEVVKIGGHDGYTIAGKYIEPAETYPSSETWGSDGFTYTTLENAKNRFASMRETPSKE